MRRASRWGEVQLATKQTRKEASSKEKQTARKLRTNYEQRNHVSLATPANEISTNMLTL
jgi:hypothetical protein